MIAAAAPPADSPAMYTRVGSTARLPMICRVIPAIREGSPLSRSWSSPLNQFQHFEEFADGDCAGIGDEEALLFRQFVHSRSGGEVVGRLLAAVQHHNQWQRFSAITAWDEELVPSAASLHWHTHAPRSGLRPATVSWPPVSDCRPAHANPQEEPRLPKRSSNPRNAAVMCGGATPSARAASCSCVSMPGAVQ